MPEIPQGLFKVFRPKEYDRRLAFKVLRETALAQSRQDTARRIQTNPQKTPFEQALGIYIEQLEPQVRDAVVKMRELGYSTTLSGFWDKDYHQTIQGDFTLDKATQVTLKARGVSVKEYLSFGYPCTAIEFQAATPDLEAIRRKWNNIVDSLPPTNQPVLDHPRWHLAVDRMFERENQEQQAEKNRLFGRLVTGLRRIAVEKMFQKKPG